MDVREYVPIMGDKMKKAVIYAAFAILFATAASAEVYPKDKLIAAEKERAGGTGEGKLSGKFSFQRDKALKTHAVKEIGWMTLLPGASIGYHKHTDNEDAYIIISGEGTFKDTDGKEYTVKAGDITIVRPGESHGLANNGKEPLVFLDVIAAQ